MIVIIYVDLVSNTPTIKNLFLNKAGFYTTSMRFLIRARTPTEAGNKVVQDPNFLTRLEEYMNKAKPEAETA
jgi:hypothetical protein